MNGFIKVEIATFAGMITCWQKVVDGIVVDRVDASGNTIAVPDLRLERCVTGELVNQPGV